MRYNSRASQRPVETVNYAFFRNLLFMMPTELSHHVSLSAIGLAGSLKLGPLVSREVPIDPVTVMGIEFPNRVGLAAGLDKDAKCIDGFAALGFGFVEVGTVTPRSQPGNPKPRLFRLPEERAIINRMGFNNEGADAMSRRIRHSNFHASGKGVLGVNIGKNFDTPVESALDDYVSCMRRLYRSATYLVVNISSPNTPGLRSLQAGDELPRLLEGLKQEHRRLIEKHGKVVPLVIKIAPDMTDDEIRIVSTRLLEFELDGVIVSNTTVDRENIAGSPYAKEQGGLSGEPLRDKANHALEVVASELKDRIAIIGVGGIMTGEDAAHKIALGADLVQIYTGFIYAGPDLVYDSVMAIKNAQAV